MKVLLIAGSFPPLKCGVGDYTRYLATALASLADVTVTVLTSEANVEDLDPPAVDVRRLLPDWRLVRIGAVLALVADIKPDVIHIQYPTREYRGWLAVSLPAILRLRGFPVVQTWHEHFSQCRAISWPNLLGCDTLVHVREDLPERLPRWVRWFLRRTPIKYIPNAGTIPTVTRSAGELATLKHEVSADRPIVAFFGFANPNKGVERLFSIADPGLHHLLLICDLHSDNPYHRTVQALIDQPAWRDHVLVTGFQPAGRVADLLAIADAAVFPFPAGGGDWNTSLQAAEAAGVFTISTSTGSKALGYNSLRNRFVAQCADLAAMRDALANHAGKRIGPADSLGSWHSIALAHEAIYRSLTRAQAQ